MQGCTPHGVLLFLLIDRVQAMSDEIIDAIKANAAGPKSVSGDSGSVQQHDLNSQIAADKHVAAAEGVKSKGRGLRFTKLISPGPV